MTNYKIASRGLTSWQNVEGALDMVPWPTEYETSPPSISHGILASMEFAAAQFTVWCNGVDFDYKFTDGGDPTVDMILVGAAPVDDPENWTIILTVQVTTGWTHVHYDLSPGSWLFQIGVMRGASGAVQGWFDNFEFSPTLILTAENPLVGACYEIPTGALTLTAGDPSMGAVYEIPAGALTLYPKNPSYTWALPGSALPAAQIIYTCTLTGDADSLDDLTLPMSSFQCRLRDGDPSYVSCVIPNSLAYEDGITARQNGDIVIRKGYRLQDGMEQLEEIARVDFESLAIDRGARSDSATIIGHRTVTSTAPKDRDVTGVSYYALQADGKRRVRAAMDLFLRCGDTCIYGDEANDSFIAGQITYIVAAKPPMAIMEVTER